MQENKRNEAAEGLTSATADAREDTPVSVTDAAAAAGAPSPCADAACGVADNATAEAEGRPAADARSAGGAAPAEMPAAAARGPGAPAAGKRRRVRIDWPYTLGIAALTLLSLVIYLFGARLGWAWMFWLYLALFWGGVVAYIVVNHGFSRTRVSRNQLPARWSEAEKEEYLAAEEGWRRRSKPILLLLVPLGITFFYDVIDLYFGDVIRDLLRYVGVSL